MRRAVNISPAGTWSPESMVATVSLNFDERFRRRLRLKDDENNEFLLDLPKPNRLKDGDGLVLEGGGLIAVCAAPESIIEIKCSSDEDRSRIAWHLGNRHTPVQVLVGGNLRIQVDHVLEQMVIGLGASTLHLQAAFEPEGGAYENNSGHEHY